MSGWLHSEAIVRHPRRSVGHGGGTVKGKCAIGNVRNKFVEHTRSIFQEAADLIASRGGQILRPISLGRIVPSARLPARAREANPRLTRGHRATTLLLTSFLGRSPCVRGNTTL